MDTQTIHNSMEGHTDTKEGNCKKQRVKEKLNHKPSTMALF